MREDEDELHAWCLLEESWNERWQKVTRKKSKLEWNKLDHESLLGVENNSGALLRKIIEVNDNWVSIRATLACHAGRDVPERKSWTVRTQQRDSLQQTIPIKSVEGAHRCRRNASAAKPYLNEKGRASWQCRSAGGKDSAHSKQSRRHTHQAM